MAYERSLVKKLQGLPVQILGINLDTDAKETHERCVKEGVTWPSFSGKWDKFSDALYNSSIPQFYLVDSNGIVRFEISGGGSNFEVKFMRKVEELLAEMGHEIELVDPNAKAEAEKVSSVTIRRASGEVFDRFKRGESVDQQFLKSLTPKGLGPERSDEFLVEMLRVRSNLAMSSNHSQTHKFIREFSEIENAERLDAFAWACYGFSQQFDIDKETSEACLDLSQRAVKLDPSYSPLETCAHWLAAFPERIDEAIEMQEKAIQLFQEEEKEEGDAAKEKHEEYLVFMQNFLEELNAR